FTPFIIYFIGAIIIILAVTVVFKVFVEVLGEDRVPSWIYAVFTSLMLVYPMNGEVFIYYMHNGMGVAFLLSAIAIYLVYSVKGQKLKAQLLSDISALILMVLAICCYESFSLVIVTVGVCLVLLKSFIYKKIELKTDGIWVATVVVMTAVAMVLRSIITKILCAIMGLDVYQTSGGMIGWQFSDNAAEIGATLKNQLMRNFLFYGAGYFPISLFLFAVVVLLVICGIVSWKNRDFWPIVLGILLVIGQFSISFLLGVMQLYRMSQSIVVLVAFSVFILLVLISKWRIGRVVAVI
ncbi:MAG: glucosyltransferase domain-containing protein, partial [Pseudobutyrivibrio sp.]|nr:glucosyltransferase domain-containing protein [Pseudobutyrivibrio sp.]